MATEIERIIEMETKARLEEMERPDYKFPKSIDWRDWAVIVASIAVSAVLIGLCMVGVIA